MERSRRGSLWGLALAQLAVTGAVVGYAAAAPLHPDGGLQQVDIPTLDQPVPGIAGTGRPQLVVATGDLAAPRCRAQLEELTRRRGRPGGVAASYDVTVLVPSADAPPGARADPGGALARALGLGRAADGCAPGYAVVDPSGSVRYRTYDPGYAAHGSEQSVLLGSLR